MAAQGAEGRGVRIDQQRQVIGFKPLRGNADQGRQRVRPDQPMHDFGTFFAKGFDLVHKPVPFRVTY